MAVKRLIGAFLFVTGLSVAVNMEKPILEAGQAGTNQQDDPLKMARAPTWQERRAALERVLRKHELSEATLRIGIVQLFTRETDDPRWEEEAEFDDFNEYYGRLNELCQYIAQIYHEQRAWRALVFSVYNPDSRYAKWLIAQPEALPLLLEMSNPRTTRVWKVWDCRCWEECFSPVKGQARRTAYKWPDKETIFLLPSGRGR